MLNQKQIITVSDGSLSFFRDDYEAHWVSGFACNFLTVKLSKSPYQFTAEYKKVEQRDKIAKELCDILSNPIPQ